MRFSYILAALLFSLISAIVVGIYFGAFSINASFLDSTVKTAGEVDIGYRCHEEAPSLCVVGLGDDIRAGRLELPTSILPTDYPLDLDRSAVDASGASTMLKKQFELSIYLSENFDQRLTLAPAPKLKSSACSGQGQREIKRLGDIYTFFRDCAAEQAEAENRFMVIGLRLNSEINDDLRPLMEYLYATQALATYEPYSFDFPNQSFVLELGSPGGDPYAAMGVGDLVFGAFSAVLVRPEGCASACVFLLVAGRDRHLAPWDDPSEFSTLSYPDRQTKLDGLVAVHSPIPNTSSDISMDELASLRAEFETASRAYLSRFGASPDLVDLMMKVPSGRVQYLTSSEMERLGLIGESVLKTDLDRLERIKTCGREFDARLIAFENALKSECDGSIVAPDDSESSRKFWACRNDLIRGFRVTTDDCQTDGVPLFDPNISLDPIQP